MQEAGEGKAFVLPDSKMTFTFTDSYSHEALADLTREAVKNPALAKRFSENVQDELARVGIQVTNVEKGRITDEDVLVALGHRGADLQSITAEQNNVHGQAPLVAVIVIIAVFKGSSNLID